MRVIRYKYERKAIDGFKFNATTFDWIELQNSNLMVGKNASGKSTVSNILVAFTRLFLPSQAHQIGQRTIELVNSKGKQFTYHYEGEIKGVVKESLYRDAQLLFDRDFSDAKIYSEAKRDFEQITPPANKPIIQVRRDAKDYPYLEELAQWAEGIHSIKFGNVNPAAFNKTESERGFNIEDFNKALESLDLPDKETIITEFNSLGYDLKVIDIKKLGDQNILFVKEAGLKYELRQESLSQGMFRSLALLIYLHYIINKKKAQLIIIDDLCEGLDFDRATNLGKLLFNKAKDKGIQFLATSNDFFLMNVVTIDIWNIIKRDTTKIKVYNYKNSKEKFDEFKFLGLNNFQLFASDYLEEKKND